MRPANLWITGVRGLVGQALASQITAPFVGTGREVDIADLQAVRAWGKQHPHLTHVVNCAAFSQVDPAETERAQAHRDNALGPEVLGAWAEERGIEILHLSTDYVFSGEGRTPLRETDPTAPCNHYAATKLEGEERLLRVCPRACVLRTSWVFGPGGKNFVAKLFRLLQTEEELRLVADQTGRPTYAPDLVRAILALLQIHPLPAGIYHFANRGATNKYEFALACREEMEALHLPVRCRSIVPLQSSEFPALARRPLYSAFDTTKVETLLGWQPRTWREALKEFVHASAH